MGYPRYVYDKTPSGCVWQLLGVLRIIQGNINSGFVLANLQAFGQIF